MAPSLITKYQVDSAAADNTTLTTPSFTPSNGEVIGVLLSTWDTANGMAAPTGGSQTYQPTPGAVAPGGFNGWVGIWVAKVSGSPGPMTVSSAPATAGNTRHTMTVSRWSGAQLAASPANTNGTGVNSVPSLSLTTTAANSVILWVISDAQSIDPATRAYLLSGVEDGLFDGHVGSNGVMYFAHSGASAVTTAGSYTYGLSAPGGQTWVMAGVEIQASTSTATFPPEAARSRRVVPLRIARTRQTVLPRPQVNPPNPIVESVQPRRLRGLLLRRTKLTQVVPAQVNPPLPIVESVQPRRLRGIPVRRGKLATPVPPQVNPPYPWAESVQPRRPRGLLSRRGKSAESVPSQVTFTNPAWAPQTIRIRVRVIRLFRTKLATPVPPQVNPPYPWSEVVQPRRVRGLLIRRGKLAAPVLPQVNPPFPWSEVVQPRRLRGLLARRGKQTETVPTQVTFANPAWVPQSVRVRVRIIRLFRGKSASVVPPQVNPPLPIAEVVQPRRARGATPRRARGTDLGPQSPPMVQSGSRRPRGYPTTRRARVVSPPRAIVVTGSQPGRWGIHL